jgi:amino acid adenylation domain-containing protein
MSFQPIHEMFRETAGRFAGHTALEADGRRVTYRTLEERSNRLAGFLAQSGEARGAVCGIFAEGVTDTVVAMLASLKAGGIFVILNPALPKARLETLTEMARPAWLLTESRLLERLRDNVPVGDARVICLDGEELAAFDGPAPAGASDPDAPCYIYFTSGSTGRPKGIVGRLSGIDHFIRWEIETFGVRAGTRVSQLTTPSFDAFLRDIFTPLCAGGTSVHPEPGTLLDGQRLADWLDIEEIELVHCVPSLFRTLLATDLNPQYFSALRHILLSGEPVLPSDVERWTRTFGDRTQLVNLYGPTETTMTKLFYLVRPEDRERRSIPIGKPMPGARAVLLDRNRKAVAPGAIGEIYIRTPYRTLGYLKDPEQTSRAFVPNPFAKEPKDPNDLLYRTGDLARLLDDGNFEFLGRADQQVKIRGIRIELPEIESHLRRHPALEDVAVVDRDDAAGGKLLCAYVVTRGPVTASALREHLLQELPEAMVPTAFAFMKELPRTITGKIDRQALPSPSSADGEDRAYVAPRTKTEEELAAIWISLLGIERAGVDQSFFELGGHSLLATQLLSRIRTVFDVELPLGGLFDAPTLEKIAARVDQMKTDEVLADPARAGAQASSVPPLMRVPRDRPLPLSFAQERLWLVDQLQPGNPAYNVPQLVDIRGPLDIAKLRRSLELVVERHEGLRTAFPAADGRPSQRIQPSVRVEIPVTDLSGSPDAGRDAVLQPLLLDEIRRPFDLARGPLFRARLFKLGPDFHRLALTLHHIVSDDWSRGILTRDWTSLYASLVTGTPAGLPELKVQIADFADWQRRWMTEEVLERELAFWKRALGTLENGTPPVLGFPTDRPRPAVMDFAGGRVSLLLPAGLTERLNELCHREGLTLFMAGMAAVQLLLGRAAHQEQVSVGTPIAGRNRAEVEDLIGFFVNTLVVRSDFSGNPTFREYLRRVRQLTLEIFEHQETPLEKIVEALQPERTRSHAPLFQAVFAMQNVPFRALQVAGLEFSAPFIDTGAIKADLDLDLADTGEGLFATLAYASSLFDATTMHRLLHHLQNLLEEAAADPDRLLSEIPSMTRGERHQLLHEWNDTAHPTHEVLPLHRLFEACAKSAPEALAAVSAEGRLTYAELDRSANRLARHLRTLGVGPDVIVGLCTDRSFDFLVGMLGILKAGGAFLAMDPSHPAERLAFIMRDAQVSVLVAQEELADALPMHWGFNVYLDRDRSAISKQEDGPLQGGAALDNAAYVIYTSGSTGQPKGVVVPHRGVHNFAVEQWRAFGLGAEDRVLQFSSASFDASISEILMALTAGASLWIGPREEMMPGASLTRLLEERAVTAVTLPPSALAVTPAATLPALSTVTVAGEACPQEVVAAWAPGRRFLNLYGPTEASIWASFDRCQPGDGAPSIGRPIGNVRLHVVDRSFQPVPIGTPGELTVGGIGLTRGYLGRPELTAERFIPNHLGDHGEAGGRLYRTGDLVRLLPDGRLQFLGRIDHQVKIRGYRVELQEIELALGHHADVAEAAVVAREEGADRRLAAYVSTREGASLEVAGLRDHLAEQLPEYMVPSIFVLLEHLPHLPSGKIDRASLPAPDRAHLGRKLLRLPSTPVEEVLAEVWREVLGFEEVGLDESFFDLGGHSLAATRVLSRVREIFHVDYPLGQLFATPTLAHLASGVEAALRGAPAASVPPLEALGRERDIFELSPVQEQVWNDHSSVEGLIDHVPAAFRLEGELDTGALGAALTEIVRRHEALRTSFPLHEGRRVQRIHPPRPVDLPIENLSLLDEELRTEICSLRTRETALAPFDLEAGPLLRTLLLRLGDREHVLVLVCHHMVFDQWSAGIFTRELSQLYAAFASGRPSPLAELALQYADFSAWQRGALAGETLDAAIRDWRRRLAGAVPLALPVRSRPADAVGPTASETFSLSAETSRALQEICRERRATPYMLPVAAFKIALAEATGQHDIVVRTPIANRTRTEIEPLIGFFPNELVLRTDLTGDPSCLEVLDRVRNTMLEAYLHQNVPFEAVVRALRTEVPRPRDLMRVTCNYYSAPAADFDLPGLQASPIGVTLGTMRPDLMFLLADRSDGFDGVLHFRTDTLDEHFVRVLAGRLLSLLESIALDPARRLSELLDGVGASLPEELVGLCA